MTWEETIVHIRKEPEYKDLVEKTYVDENLALNIERFRKSQEFSETLRLLKQFAPGAKRILDVGSGNGISAVSLALEGYHVTTTEPDPSNTVGSGAIRKLVAHYKLTMDVYEQSAEDLQLEKGLFDIIYVRQAMHHAHNLKKFVMNLSRLLKPKGLFVTIRDHVIINEADKKLFLESHPLHHFYGGENAFTAREYAEALNNAGLRIKKELRHYDSAINYFPATKDWLDNYKRSQLESLRRNLNKRLGLLGRIPGIFLIYKSLKNKSLVPDENKVPGRMYSYFAEKI